MTITRMTYFSSEFSGCTSLAHEGRISYARFLGSRCGLGSSWSCPSFHSDGTHHRDDSLSAILRTRQAPTSPNTKESPTVLPTLKKAYGMSLKDRRVHDNLLRDIYVLNKKHANSSMLYCKTQKNVTPCFVHVPSSKGSVQTKANS
jgi:hypothetical protein